MHAVTYLEDFRSDSALHFVHWGIGALYYQTANDCQRLMLQIGRKHALVEVDFFHRQSTQ